MNRMTIALCLMLAACRSNADNGSDNGTTLADAVREAEPITKMLKAGEPEACAHPAVKLEFQDRMSEGLTELKEGGNITPEKLAKAKAETPMPTLSNFQALDSNAVGAMTCAVNVGKATITYILRPSLEDDNQFLIAFPQQTPNYLWFMAVLDRLPKTPPAPYNPNPYGNSATTLETGGRPQSNIWKAGGTVTGTCFAKVGSAILMDGPCSGAGHGTSVFVTAERDGCSIDLSRHGASATGSLFAYKDACGELESDVNLGSFSPDGACWASQMARVCVQPGRGPYQ